MIVWYSFRHTRELVGLYCMDDRSNRAYDLPTGSEAKTYLQMNKHCFVIAKRSAADQAVTITSPLAAFSSDF